MVVEHEFITTLESQDALGRISAFLAERGFTAGGQAAFQALTTDARTSAFTLLEMKRGKKKPTRARRLGDLPQAIMAQYDRGRVEVACLIRPWRDKPKDLHTRASFAMLRSLEQLLAGDPAGAAHEWAAAESAADAELWRSRRRYHIIMYSILAIIAALIATIIILAVVMD